MSQLKNEALKRCFSLLREFVDESTVADNKKGTAILALNQLQRVIAGGDVNTDALEPGCLGRPIADRTDAQEPGCLGRPIADRS
ncbi:MAG: hypothetical protein QG657_502 [Acidobacteriota bacterium]|nr:hypothetical protein [Acidobacteriota bacterium]